MKNKIPKELLKLLKQRENTGGKMLVLNGKIEKILTDLNIANTLEYAELQNDYDCMQYTEPSGYYNMTVNFLEKQLNK